MGCFNKTGFLSHLPITYGDEIVMFVCADSYSARCRKDDTPISIVGTGMTPIAPPFFGEYNDYGNIEKVVDDANHQLFRKKTGMTLEEFCDIMNDLSGITIGNLKDFITKLKNGEKEPNNYHHETIEDYEKHLALLKSLFGEEPVMKEYAGDDEAVKKAYASIYEHEMEKYNNSCLLLCMEHKSVYDKMVSVGREHYFDYWIGYKNEKKITLEEAFDNTTEIIMALSEFEDQTFNPFKFGLSCETLDIMHSISKKITNDTNISIEMQENLLKLLSLSKDIVMMRESFGIMACLHETASVDTFDYVLYNNLSGDMSPFKDIACDFIYFITSMKRMCVTFEPSPYHNQTVCYETTIPIFEEILATLKRKAEKDTENNS